MNEFIESNAPRNVRNLRFTPPPKYDEFGNLIQSSSDTEDSPEATSNAPSAPVQMPTVNIGFAGDSDEDEPELPSAAPQNQPSAIPAVPSVGVGFAGSDDEQEAEQPPAGPVHVENAAPGGHQVEHSVSLPGETAEVKPVIAGTSIPGGFAGDSDHEDTPAAQGPAAVGPNGFAANSDDEGDGDIYFPDLAAQTAPQRNVGFAGYSDDEMDAALPPAAAAGVPPLPSTATMTAAAGDAASGPNSMAAQSEPPQARLTDSAVGQTVSASEATRASPARPLATGTPVTQATTESSAGVSTVRPTSESVPAGPSTSSAAVKDVVSPHDAGSTKSAEASPPGTTESVASSASRPQSVVASRTVHSPKTVPSVLPDARTVASAEGVSQMSPPPVPRRSTSRLSPEKASPVVEPSGTAARRLSEGPSRNASPLSSDHPAVPSDQRRRSSSALADQARASSVGASQVEQDLQRTKGKKRRATDDLQDRRDRDLPEDATGTLKGLKIRKKANDAAAATSSLEVQRPSPAVSGESDSRSSGQAHKVHDPFNHGRSRTHVKNGYVTIHPDVLRQKNLVQAIAPHKNIDYPDAVSNSPDLEVGRIKYLWSVGRAFGNPLQGSDTFDEAMSSPSGLDVWIAAPPPENQAGRDKAARSQVNDYLTLQLLVSSYGNVRQADSPRASVRAVFVHRSKLAELGTTTGKYAELEHSRANTSVRFYAYGFWNGKRSMVQIWRAGELL